MPKSSRFSNALSRRHLLLPYLLIAPAVAVLLALSIYPLIYSITVSLSVGNAWGIGNFTRLLSDNFFLAAMAHTFVYAAAARTC
jgi:ABC-type sugar transport system permease subunit